MEDLAKVQKIQKSLHRSIVTLDILMLCYEDTEARKQLDFAKERYQELLTTTLRYQKGGLTDEEKEISENQITNDCERLFSLLQDLKEQYFNIFKVITVMIINNKRDSEIDKFYKEVSKCLKSFDSIIEARDYLFYNSGIALEKFIHALLDYINIKDQQVVRHLPVKFLEKYQTIITLTFKEWVDIFNNIKFTLKYVGNINKTKYHELIKKYDRLEVVYFILLAARDAEYILMQDAAVASGNANE